MIFNLETFSSTYFAPTIIILGLFGNLFGLIVISKKKLAKIGPQTVYTALFIFDWINFILIFQPFALFAFNIDITVFSSLYCKIYFYISFIFAPISPILNVYISIERYISIAYPTKKYFLLKNKIQLAYIIVLALFNLLLYVPTGLYFDLVIIENQTICNYVDLFWQETYGYIDLTNRIIIPSVLMITFSILIIHTIFTSRSRISSNTRANRTFRKDVKFSIISITLNISYIVFNLPLSILLFFQNYWLYSFYSLIVFIYYITFAANFYLIFLANSLFREGFYSIFGCEKKRRNTNNAAVARENIELQNIQNNRQTN
jgi:hypothetical protein